MLRFVLAAVFAVLSVIPAFAQSACTPEKLNSAIDAYAGEPFGARAWRKLSGLGDDGTTAISYDSGEYENSQKWRELVQPLVASDSPLANPAYNCRVGYPLTVLQARTKTFGATSDYVKAWLKGQEDVFRACSGSAVSNAEVAIPNGLKPVDVDLLKQDLAYQKATVQFYAQPQLAIPLFKAIAAGSSPHKASARYNIANIFANAKNVLEARAEAKAILADPSLSSVHDITRDLQGYISNVEDTAAGWSSLIDETVATLNEPSSAFANRQGVLAKALYDIGYEGVGRKVDDWWVTGKLPENPTLSKALVDASRKHPMVLWMMTGQSNNEAYVQLPWALIGPKWNAGVTSYVDRALALQAKPLPDLPRSLIESLKASTDDASRAKLWSMAQAVADKTHATCGDAPETAAVTVLALQATRVSALAGRFDEIYANLPKLKLDGSASLRQTILPKLMQHLLASGQVEEGRRMRNTLLTDAFFAGFKTDEGYLREPYAQLMSYVAEDETQFLKALDLMTERLSPELLNFLPASKLRALADHGGFSAKQQALLKRAAWTRNVVIGARNKTETTEAMYAANPDVAKIVSDIATQYPKLKPEDARTLTILRNPRFGILVNSPDAYTMPIETVEGDATALAEYDPNDRNWWCPLQPDRHWAAVMRDLDDMTGLTEARLNLVRSSNTWLDPYLEPALVDKADTAGKAMLKQHPMIKAIDWKEVDALAKAPSGPKLLTQAALKWAKAAKGDPAASEALALAVRSTRYGCRWAGSHEAYSKPAQEFLKTKYPQSEWTKQTPYWFGCMDTQSDNPASCKPREWKKQELPR